MANVANVPEEKVTFFFPWKCHPKQGSHAGTCWDDHQDNEGNNKIPELLVYYRDKVPLLK